MNDHIDFEVWAEDESHTSHEDFDRLVAATGVLLRNIDEHPNGVMFHRYSDGKEPGRSEWRIIIRFPKELQRVPRYVLASTKGCEETYFHLLDTSEDWTVLHEHEHGKH